MPVPAQKKAPAAIGLTAGASWAGCEGRTTPPALSKFIPPSATAKKKAPTEAGALYDRETSIHRLALPRLLPLDLLSRRQHPLPYPLPAQAALLKHGIGVLCRLKSGVLSVLADEH